MSGRQTGPFVAYRPDAEVEMVFPPRGRTFSVTQTHWFRMSDCRVAEHWANRDDLAMGQQLGWNPPTLADTWSGCCSLPTGPAAADAAWAAGRPVVRSCRPKRHTRPSRTHSLTQDLQMSHFLFATFRRPVIRFRRRFLPIAAELVRRVIAAPPGFST